MTNKKSPEKLNPTVYMVFLSLLLDLLAFTMILPLFPSMLQYYKSNDSSGLYDYLSNYVKLFQNLVTGSPDSYNSVLFGGFLGSLFSFLQFVVSPIVGGFSDVYGRKPLMFLCTLGILSSYYLWTISTNFTVFIIARIVGGLSKGNISLYMAVITDLTNVQNRGRGMALVGIAFSIGFIVGPMIGAMFSKFVIKHPYCAICLTLANLLVIGFGIKESLPSEKRIAKFKSSMSYAVKFLNISSIFSFSIVNKLKAHEKPTLQRIGFIYFVYLFVYSGLEFTASFLMFHKFGFNSIDQAKMFLTTATSFVVTCMTTMVSKFGNVDEKGTILGVFRSLGALARALGPVFGSIVSLE
uniref:Major facilitator superfamily (MFS) profile domain-containing protein n=1 Tax=Megaselia scalaris TaxID=36166 RepID=T1GV22_MEGSC